MPGLKPGGGVPGAPGGAGGLNPGGGGLKFCGGIPGGGGRKPGGGYATVMFGYHNIYHSLIETYCLTGWRHRWTAIGHWSCLNTRSWLHHLKYRRNLVIIFHLALTKFAPVEMDRRRLLQVPIIRPLGRLVVALQAYLDRRATTTTTFRYLRCYS